MIFFFLIFVAVWLIAVLSPWGILCGLIAWIRNGKWSYFRDRNHDIAYAIDVFGGVLYAEYFEWLFLTKNSKFRFVGNRKLTISAILGLNKNFSEMKSFGYTFSRFLDWIDPDKSFGGHVTRAVYYELGESEYITRLINEHTRSSI